MKEYSENIKKLSVDDVIRLSNYSKRQAFIKNYPDWGIWLEIPEINVNIYKAVLPNDSTIIITEYLKSYQLSEAPTYCCRYSAATGVYSKTPCGDNVVIDELKCLKIQLCNERRAKREEHRN